MSQLDRNRLYSEPVYSVPEVAWILGVNRSTLRTWFCGRDYPAGRSTKRWSALMTPACRTPLQLSFENLLEAHVLSAIRAYRIEFERIRAALQYVAREFQTKHPLLEKEFETDGIDLFVREGKLQNVSSRQLTLHEALRLRLERVARGSARGDRVPVPVCETHSGAVQTGRDQPSG